MGQIHGTPQSQGVHYALRHAVLNLLKQNSCGNNSALPAGNSCGAGGNRTPVHQPLSARDTTIPTSTLRSVTGGSATRYRSNKSRYVFPDGHRSFPTSTVFPVVIPRFCCRAAVNWPRATLRLTIALLPLFRRRERTACWQLFFCPV